MGLRCTREISEDCSSKSIRFARQGLFGSMSDVYEMYSNMWSQGSLDPISVNAVTTNIIFTVIFIIIPIIIIIILGLKLGPFAYTMINRIPQERRDFKRRLSAKREPERADSQFCIACNASLPLNAKFCDNCGAPQTV